MYLEPPRLGVEDSLHRSKWMKSRIPLVVCWALEKYFFLAFTLTHNVYKKTASYWFHQVGCLVLIEIQVIASIMTLHEIEKEYMIYCDASSPRIRLYPYVGREVNS